MSQEKMDGLGSLLPDKGEAIMVAKVRDVHIISLTCLEDHRAFCDWTEFKLQTNLKQSPQIFYATIYKIIGKLRNWSLFYISYFSLVFNILVSYQFSSCRHILNEN